MMNHRIIEFTAQARILVEKNRKDLSTQILKLCLNELNSLGYARAVNLIRRQLQGQRKQDTVQNRMFEVL